MEVRRTDNIGNFSKGSLYFQPTADSMQEPADSGVSHHLRNMRVKMLSTTSWEKGIFLLLLLLYGVVSFFMIKSSQIHLWVVVKPLSLNASWVSDSSSKLCGDGSLQNVSTCHKEKGLLRSSHLPRDLLGERVVLCKTWKRTCFYEINSFSCLFI